MKYWLFKTEPTTFSWNDLKSLPGKTTTWEGVRNYQARNFFKEMSIGDRVFFYHSGVKPLAIYGIARVVRAAYPDPFQFDPSSRYFDPSSPADNPRWLTVDIQWVEDFKTPVERDRLAGIPGLEDMVLLQRGSRLSIQPVAGAEWNIIVGLSR